MSTIIMPTTLFGKLLIEPGEDLWEDCLIEMDGKDLDVTLSIDGGVVTQETHEQVRDILESLPAMCRRAKDCMSAAYPEDETVAGYVDYLMAELPIADLEAALNVRAASDVTVETFFDALEPCHFALSAAGGLSCRMDFTIGRDYADAVLCVVFDAQQNILSIRHES